MDGLHIFCEDKNPLLKLPDVSITESGGLSRRTLREKLIFQ